MVTVPLTRQLFVRALIKMDLLEPTACYTTPMVDGVVPGFLSAHSGDFLLERCHASFVTVEPEILMLALVSLLVLLVSANQS
jgi:hypothetical protein